MRAASDGEHCESAEPERQDAADKEPDDDEGTLGVDGGEVHDLCVGDEEGERGERGRTDGEAFSDGSGRVADAVEFVGAFADFVFEGAHFGNTAGIVGDGAVGVDGELDTGGGEHAEGRKGDAVQTAGEEGTRDGDADEENGNDAGNHTNGETADDVCGRSCRGGFGNGLDRTVGVRCVELSELADEGAGDKTARHCEEDHRGVHLDGAADGVVIDQTAFGEDDIGDAVDGDGRQDGGRNRAHVEGVLRVRFFVAAAHDETAQETDDDAGRGDEERKHDGVELASFGRPQGRAQHGRTDDRTHIGFKQIRAHPGDVADVVTDVVGNDGGVSGVVLGNAGFDFADEVRPNVGRLGVNPAAHSGKQRNRRCAEAKARQHFQDFLHTFAGKHDVRVEQKQADDAQQAKPHDRHAHDGTAAKRHGQGILEPGTRRRRRAHVGLGRHAHPDVPRRRTAERPDDKR